MFDIGFTEIVVIAVVALIVLGPERLPKAARTLGHLFGRLQRYVADVKADINREMRARRAAQAADRRCRPRRSDFESSIDDRGAATSSGRPRASSRAQCGGRRGRRGGADRRRRQPRLRAGAAGCARPAPLPAPRRARRRRARPSLPGFDRD